MSERTTGATDEQIEAAIDTLADTSLGGNRRISRTYVAMSAPYLVPPDHRIFDPDDLAAVQRLLGWGTDMTPKKQLDKDLIRIAALIGDSNG